MPRPSCQSLSRLYLSASQFALESHCLLSHANVGDNTVRHFAFCSFSLVLDATPSNTILMQHVAASQSDVFLAGSGDLVHRFAFCNNSTILDAGHHPVRNDHLIVHWRAEKHVWCWIGRQC